MFHLLSHIDGSGGESTLVDGFAAASFLYSQNKAHYESLSSIRFPSHASGDPSIGRIDNTPLSGGFPVLTHTPRFADSISPLQPNNLSQIRWNNDDRDLKMNWSSTKSLQDWYAAARAWSEILRMKEFEIRVQLEPGKPVIFDNWRMLHGRTGFTGQRRVVGGYLNMDDFMARWRFLNTKNENTEVAKTRSEGHV